LRSLTDHRMKGLVAVLIYKIVEPGAT